MKSIHEFVVTVSSHPTIMVLTEKSSQQYRYNSKLFFFWLCFCGAEKSFRMMHWHFFPFFRGARKWDIWVLKSKFYLHIISIYNHLQNTCKGIVIPDMQNWNKEEWVWCDGFHGLEDSCCELWVRLQWSGFPGRVAHFQEFFSLRFHFSSKGGSCKIFLWEFASPLAYSVWLLGLFSVKGREVGFFWKGGRQIGLWDGGRWMSLRRICVIVYAGVE